MRYAKLAADAGAAELARLLARTGETPIECDGAMAVFEAIAGSGPLIASMSVHPRRCVLPRERELLRAGERDEIHQRDGVLRCAAGVPVAEVIALVVTCRVPAPARPALSITPSGRLIPGHSRTPLGNALRGLGVRIEQLGVARTPGRADEAGAGQVLASTALLRTASGLPLALVTERVYARFLAAYPPPWPLAQAAARAAR